MKEGRLEQLERCEYAATLLWQRRNNALVAHHSDVHFQTNIPTSDCSACTRLEMLVKQADIRSFDLQEEIKREKRKPIIDVLKGKNFILVESEVLLSNRPYLEADYQISLFGASSIARSLFSDMDALHIEGGVMHISADKEVEPVLEAWKNGKYIVAIISTYRRQTIRDKILQAGVPWVEKSGDPYEYMEEALEKLADLIKSREQTKQD